MLRKTDFYIDGAWVPPITRLDPPSLRCYALACEVLPIKPIGDGRRS